MNIKTRLILIVALLGMGAVLLVAALMQRGATPTPAMTAQPATDRAATEDTMPLSGETSAPVTPGATAATTPPGGAVVELSVSEGPPTPTPTPTEGEKAAAAIGKEYSNYRPTKAECNRAVESGELGSCVAPDSIRLVTLPEWEQLFPNTDFYVIGLAGRDQDQLYDHSYRRRLVAWQDNHRYTAETFDRLLAVNEITITDENRELVAKAFVLMTIPDYLEEEVVFTKWEEVDMPQAAYPYNYCVDAWTKIEGLEAIWCFVFRNEQLKVASGPFVQQARVGDYIPVSPSESLSHPLEDYRFRGE